MAAAESKAQIVNTPISKVMVRKAVVNSNVSQQQHGSSNTGTAQQPKQDSPSSNEQNPSSGAVTVHATSGAQYSVTVLPAESDDLNMRVVPVSGFWSQSQINVQKYANSDIPTSVDSQFTDLTVSRIQSTGAILTTVATAAISLAASKQACPDELPEFVARVKDLLTDLPVPGTNCWKYRFSKVGESALDTVPRATFERLFLGNGVATNVWPVPACLDLTLEVYKQGTSSAVSYFSVRLRVADPKMVRLIALPEKGKISMHPICDADVSDTPSDKYGVAFDSINAGLSQALQIEKAAGGPVPGAGGANTGGSATPPNANPLKGK